MHMWSAGNRPRAPDGCDNLFAGNNRRSVCILSVARGRNNGDRYFGVKLIIATPNSHRFSFSIQQYKNICLEGTRSTRFNDFVWILKTYRERSSGKYCNCVHFLEKHKRLFNIEKYKNKPLHVIIDNVYKTSSIP